MTAGAYLGAVDGHGAEGRQNGRQVGNDAVDELGQGRDLGGAGESGVTLGEVAMAAPRAVALEVVDHGAE